MPGSSKMLNSYKNYCSILFQLILLILFATIWAFISGWLGFKSALLGGLAWIIPSSYFIWKSHQAKSLYDTKKILKCFFISETIKILLSFGIIALILLTCVIDKIAFLSSYIIVILISALISFWRGIEKW